MDENKTYRLIFTGSFGDYFLWDLFLLLSVIPLLGSWIRWLLLRWVTRNTLIVPTDLSEADVRKAISELRKADAVQRENR